MKLFLPEKWKGGDKENGMEERDTGEINHTLIYSDEF